MNPGPRRAPRKWRDRPAGVGRARRDRRARRTRGRSQTADAEENLLHCLRRLRLSSPKKSLTASLFLVLHVAVLGEEAGQHVTRDVLVVVPGGSHSSSSAPRAVAVRRRMLWSRQQVVPGERGWTASASARQPAEFATSPSRSFAKRSSLPAVASTDHWPCRSAFVRSQSVTSTVFSVGIRSTAAARDFAPVPPSRQVDLRSSSRRLHHRHAAHLRLQQRAVPRRVVLRGERQDDVHGHVLLRALLQRAQPLASPCRRQTPRCTRVRGPARPSRSCRLTSTRPAPPARPRSCSTRCARPGKTGSRPRPRRARRSRRTRAPPPPPPPRAVQIAGRQGLGQPIVRVAFGVESVAGRGVPVVAGRGGARGFPCARGVLEVWIGRHACQWTGGREARRVRAGERAPRGESTAATIFFFFFFEGERDARACACANRRNRAFAVRCSGRTAAKSGAARALRAFRAGSARAWTLDVPRDARTTCVTFARGARAGRESRRSGMRRPRGRPSWAIRVGAPALFRGMRKKTRWCATPCIRPGTRARASVSARTTRARCARARSDAPLGRGASRRTP